MDNKGITKEDFKVVSMDPKQRMADKAAEEGWEEDTDTVEMNMEDLSSIADAFNMIREGLEKISLATGVSLESV